MVQKIIQFIQIKINNMPIQSIQKYNAIFLQDLLPSLSAELKDYLDNSLFDDENEEHSFRVDAWREEIRILDKSVQDEDDLEALDMLVTVQREMINVQSDLFVPNQIEIVIL